MSDDGFVIDVPELPLMEIGVSSGLVKLAPVRSIGGVKAKKPPEGEMGVASSLPFTSFVDWVSGEMLAPNATLVSLDRLVEMRQKDGTARALLRLLTLPIMRALKDSEWIEPKEGGAEQETEFLNQVFTLPPQSGGMTVSRTRFMRHVLLSVFEGYSVFERVYQVPTEGPLKGKVTYRKLAHRDARTIRFLVDDSGGFNGVKQTANIKGGVTEVYIPKEKTWYFAVNEEENPYYGVSMFEAAWHHWDIKRKLYYIWHIAAQIAAVPARMGSYPNSADPRQIDAFQKMLSNFSFNTAGTHPKDFEVQFATQQATFSFEAAVNHQNMQMAKSVLAKFLEDDNRQVLIDNGKADASADFFVMAIESLMEELSESMTHYLGPDLIGYNFTTDKYPEFEFGILTDATKDVIKDLFSLIATAQDTMWNEEFVLEMEKKLTDRLGLEIDYDEVEARKEEEAAKQARLEQAYFQQRGGGAEAEEEPAAEEEEGGAPAEGGGVPQEVAASMTGGSLSIDRIMDRVERLMLSRRESDMDERG